MIHPEYSKQADLSPKEIMRNMPKRRLIWSMDYQTRVDFRKLKSEPYYLKSFPESWSGLITNQMENLKWLRMLMLR